VQGGEVEVEGKGRGDRTLGSVQKFKSQNTGEERKRRWTTSECEEFAFPLTYPLQRGIDNLKRKTHLGDYMCLKKAGCKSLTKSLRRDERPA